MVGATAVATGILRFAVTRGSGGSLGVSLLSSAFAFPFGSCAGESGWVAVLFSFAASSSSFAHLSSFTLRVFPLSLALVGCLERGGVVA